MVGMGGGQVKCRSHRRFTKTVWAVKKMNYKKKNECTEKTLEVLFEDGEEQDHKTMTIETETHGPGIIHRRMCNGTTTAAQRRRRVFLRIHLLKLAQVLQTTAEMDR